MAMVAEVRTGKSESDDLSLKKSFNYVLEESRMILPGIQALFGFQLVAVFNAAFSEISHFDRIVHMVALLLTIVAIACLMAPAAYHRQVESYSVSKSLVHFGSTLLCVGMIPLLTSISLDTYVVCNVITGQRIVAATAGSASFLLLLTFWYILPFVHKRHYYHAVQGPYDI
jgi:RsiW-degrading membrane proteinase PrsW (M82 family)